METTTAIRIRFTFWAVMAAVAVSPLLGCSTSGSGDDEVIIAAAPATPVAVVDDLLSIDTVAVPESIDCQVGEFEEFTASWTTTGAELVMLAIDGSGIYAELPADGEASLPFDCSSAHVYTLVAHGADGQTVSRMITVEPRREPV